ncbi:MAG: fructose-2,6-bisphosphatase [Actinomycetia bacterium]|nr:fructose-2,6-bisphosphatase [Actinomycetes bacterium]
MQAARSVGQLEAIWASPLERATATAEIIAAEIGIGPVLTTELVRERSVGEWSGLTHAEIEERYPGFLAARRSPPGFESDESVLERAIPALLAIARATPGDVLVVSHGGVIRTVERSLGVEPAALANLAGRWLDIDDGSIRPGDRVVLIDPGDVTVTIPQQL